ncbi:hypothetical protein [Halomonas sp. Cn5-12]|uniref:hypothetical protein n=1 Tax=Halomonas sp. Cn5-12 TaxID=2908885 RepID=UPI001F392D8A|nr:hypothetical protein [Halomonas sp. Cn5-12]MCF2913381.1 hypothetical protein [Halomonas sp. Cn5-12]
MTLNAGTFACRDDAEAHYLAVIDKAAADERWIDPAQAEMYRQKLSQAQVGGGGLINAEAAALGTDAETVRQAVLRNHQRWQQRITHIELARVQAKASIRNASTAAHMQAVYQTFKESL